MYDPPLNPYRQSYFYVILLCKFSTANSHNYLNLLFFMYIYLYINLASLFVCLFVCLYPINVKTAEPIGPKFFVGPHGAPG